MALRRISSSQIADSAVIAAKLGAGAVTQPKIGTGAVGSTELASDAVTSAKVATDAITSAKIASDAVTSAEIASNAVGSNELADNAVDSAAIAADAVTSAKIAADAVTSAKIPANAISSSELDLSDNYNFTGTVQRGGTNLADENYAGPAHDWKSSVVAVTAAALADYTPSGSPGGDVLTADANGALTVDGLAVADGARILVKDESGANEKHNGIRTVTDKGSASTPFILTRTEDMNSNADLSPGAITYDERRKKHYFCNAFGGTLGTDAITWEERQEGLTAQRTEGAGNGSNLNFDLGHSESLGHEVYAGSVLQPTSIYSINAGAGAGGVDRLEFDAGNAPDNLEPVDVVYFTRT